MSELGLSIVIVNWNTRHLLAQCLQSVYDTVQGLEFEVFVVDNASTDGSAEMVRERFPQVRLIENNENVGFARANNQGICLSIGRHILLLNSDTEALPGALQTMTGFLDAHPEVGAVGAALLNPDGSIQYYSKRLTTLANQAAVLFHLPGYQHSIVREFEDSEPGEVERVKGACFMIRRSAMDDIGLMDEDFFLYSEEDDWSIRLRRNGWKIFYLPNAKVVHYGGASIEQISKEAPIYLYRSKTLFFRKHHGNLAVGIFKVMLFVTYVLQCLRYALLGLTKREYHSERDVYARLLRILPGF